jgi:hypothetical protein
MVEVNHELMTEEKLHEINNFWSGHEARIRDDETALNAVLKMLTEAVARLQIEYNYNTFGIVSLFDWDDGGGQEGWPKMDGSFGIKITDVDQFLFDSSDMIIRAVN